jgi:hypothetical protein
MLTSHQSITKLAHITIITSSQTSVKDCQGKTDLELNAMYLCT